MPIPFDLSLLDDLHQPEHTETAIQALDDLRFPLAEYHTAVLEQRYDNTSNNKGPGFVIVLIGDDTDTGHQRMSTIGWASGMWCAEVVYQLMHRVAAESEIGDTEGDMPAYSDWPEELQSYVMGCVVPMEWKNAEVEFLDEHLVAFPLRGGELQAPKSFEMEEC